MMTTFGIVSTRDAGDNWDLICEGGAGYADTEPGIAITVAGTLIAGFSNGVGVGRAQGCEWSVVDLDGRPAVDVSVAAGGALALATLAGQSYIYRSVDDGASFQMLGVPLPAGLAGLTLDAAPSDAGRLYVSAIEVATEAGKLVRSDDSGQTWSVFDVPTSGTDFGPFIGAVDPNDANVVYVRSAGGPGTLFVTKDGGATFSEAYKSPTGNLRGFALSPDGSTVAVGTEFDGLWRAPTTTLAFQKVSELPIRCLTWRQAGLYACVNEALYNDCFSVGLSTDEGTSFTPLLALGAVRGPLDCDVATSVGAVCPASWPGISDQIDTPGCRGEGGGGGASGAGGATADAPSPSDDGCGCRVVGVATSPPWLALGLLLGLGLRRQRLDRVDAVVDRVR
jgi:MYXO-CTERM domain-containing protein